MKILIANSKDWFKLDDDINKNNEVFFIHKKENLNFESLSNINPELIFFPHWSWKVPKNIYEKYKCILFHTAPLPFGKGGSPIQNLILLGYKNSPVCALKMSSKLDSGDIYGKKNLSLEGPLNTIFNNLNTLVNKFIKEFIFDLPEPKKQVGKEFIFKRLNEEDNILPLTTSLEDIFNRIRMLDHDSYPNSFINYGNLKIEFNQAELNEDEIICKAYIKKNSES